MQQQQQRGWCGKAKPVWGVKNTATKEDFVQYRFVSFPPVIPAAVSVSVLSAYIRYEDAWAGEYLCRVNAPISDLTYTWEI